MRKQIFTGVTVLVLAAGLTSAAVASDDRPATNGSQVRVIHGSSLHSSRAGGHSRFAGIRGYEDWRHGGWGAGSPYRGGFIDLGPLGITAACGVRCGQGYSVSAWSR